MKRAIAIVLMMATLATAQVSTSILSDGDAIDVRVGVAAGEQMEYGIQGSWSDAKPDELWELGAYATWVIDPNATIPLRDLIPFVGTALNLPESVNARVYIGGLITVTEPFTGDANAGVGPIVGARIGPIELETRYMVYDAGGMGDFGSGAKLMLGLRLEW